MEKNENEELLEQSPAAIKQEDTQKIAKSGEEEPDTEEQKVSNGRFILWSLRECICCIQVTVSVRDM